MHILFTLYDITSFQLLTWIKPSHLSPIIGNTVLYFCPWWHISFIIVLSPFLWCPVLWFAFPMELKLWQNQNLDIYIHLHSSISCSTAHLRKPYFMLWWNLREISELEKLKLSVTYCYLPLSLWLQEIPYANINYLLFITFCRNHRGTCLHK